MTFPTLRHKRRAYQLGLKRLQSQHSKPRTRSFFRSFAMDYGSFTGALIGAIGTILAGAAAWYGTQNQLVLQSNANYISEAVYLRTEVEKIVAQRKLLDNLISQFERNRNSAAALSAGSIWEIQAGGLPSQKLIKFLKDFHFISAEDQKKYEDFSAGHIGWDYVELEKSIKKLVTLINLRSLLPLKNDDETEIKALVLNVQIQELVKAIRPKIQQPGGLEGILFQGFSSSWIDRANITSSVLRSEAVLLDRRLAAIRRNFAKEESAGRE